MKLDQTKLGLAGGILWGASLFILTLIAMQTGYSEMWLRQWDHLYPGYGISFGGAVSGLVCGFIDGFVGLYILAWLYNKLPCKSERGKRKRK